MVACRKNSLVFSYHNQQVAHISVSFESSIESCQVLAEIRLCIKQIDMRWPTPAAPRHGGATIRTRDVADTFLLSSGHLFEAEAGPEAELPKRGRDKAEAVKAGNEARPRQRQQPWGQAKADEELETEAWKIEIREKNTKCTRDENQ